MSRLIDADSLVLFPNNPESGTNEMIDNWIDECGLSNLELYITEDCPVDVEHALKELCWKVIQGYINVVDTAPTAFDVDKVMEQLEEEKMWYETHGVNMDMKKGIIGATCKAINIVKAGGIDDCW